MMKTEHGTVDRRTLFKLVGAAGAAATATSLAGCEFASASAEMMSGGSFDKTIKLATAGPGGNKDWKPGETLKFLPPEMIPTRGAAADTMAALPKEKLTQIYEHMVT